MSLGMRLAFRWYEVNRGEFRVFHLYFQHEGRDVLCTCLSYACICSETDAFTGTLMLTAAGTLMEPPLSLMSMTYMELCLKSSPPTFSVLLFQSLNGTGEFRGRDLSVSTGERLQDSIMDEHILVLGGSQGKGGCIIDIKSWSITLRSTILTENPKHAAYH